MYCRYDKQGLAKKKKKKAFRERRYLHDCDLLPYGVTWTFRQGQKSDVIKCHLLYCTLVPGMMSMGLLLCEISPFIYFMWPLTFILTLSSVKVNFTLIIICILCCWMFVPKMKSVGSVKFEIWTFVYRKHKWCHYDVITNFISMKFTYKSAKSICKWHTKFQFDQT